MPSKITCRDRAPSRFSLLLFQLLHLPHPVFIPDRQRPELADRKLRTNTEKHEITVQLEPPRFFQRIPGSLPGLPPSLLQDTVRTPRRPEETTPWNGFTADEDRRARKLSSGTK